MSKYVRKTDQVTRPPGELVDASPAMAHVRALHAKGMRPDTIARHAGVNDRVIRGLIAGHYRSGGKIYNVKRCSQEHLDSILAVPFEPRWDPTGFSREKFQRFRESKGVSRVSLAKLAGLNASTIQYWENGRSLPTRKNNFQAALQVLGASWEDVSDPVEPKEGIEPGDMLDSYSMSFRDEYVPDYPCQVCRQTFRSRRLLAEHPHPKKKVSANAV